MVMYILALEENLKRGGARAFAYPTFPDVFRGNLSHSGLPEPISPIPLYTVELVLGNNLVPE